MTGAGSILNAANSLAIGDDSCGCGFVGTLTVADGGVVNSPGATTIDAGSTLNLGTGGLAGAIITPAIDNGGRIVANFTDTLTLAANVSGVGTLSKAGAGTLILTGTNTYSGGTTIDGGTLVLGNGGAVGSIVGNVTDNGLFAVNRSDAYTFGGVISGTGGFAQIGTGTTILTGSNTYGGATTVSAGMLQAGGTNVFAPNSAFTVASGATLNLNSFNQSIGSLAGAGSVALGSAVLTTGNDNTSTIFSGTISGTGGLTKNRDRHAGARGRQHLFRWHHARERHASPRQQPGARHGRAHDDRLGGRLRQRRHHRQSDRGQQQHHPVAGDGWHRHPGRRDL